ncbi:MAG: sulfatase-like hydrolase/transferase [Halioglobus sp.]
MRVHHSGDRWRHHGAQWGASRVRLCRASFTGQGNYYDTGFNVNGKYVKTKGYVDERTVDFAIGFLEAQGDKPFAMMVGFKAVHEPFIPMPAYAGDYVEDPIQPTPNWNSVAPWSLLKGPTPRKNPKAQPFWKNLLRTVEGLDQNVGRLLDALDRLHLANNTLVIFTSDNGYYMGEHLLGDKRSAYEESMRVPLLVRLPGVVPPGTVSDALVLNIDLAPTILDVALEAFPAAMQGASLRPLLTGNPAPWREAFLYENWQEYECRGMGSPKPSGLDHTCSVREPETGYLSGLPELDGAIRSGSGPLRDPQPGQIRPVPGEPRRDVCPVATNAHPDRVCGEARHSIMDDGF